jgi:hypothetical protein
MIASAARPGRDPGETFLAQLETSFRRAAANETVAARRYRIGGANLALELAGAALVEPMTRAFGHLAAGEAGLADLHVRLWDVAATGSPPPPPPWSIDRYAARGEIEHPLGDHIRAAFSIDSGIFLCLDLAASAGYGWVRDAAALRPWDAAAPLRSLLGWWFRERGGQLVHGGAVGTDRGAVLLAGRGGSGKSSTAVECVRAGMKFLSDDYALLRPSGRELRVWSLYGSAKIDRTHLARAFPELAARSPETAHAPPPWEFDKRTVYVGELFPGRVAESLPLRAIAVPHVAEDGVTRVRAASPAEVLTALAPTTIFQLPGARADALEFMAGVARTVPGYALSLGRTSADFVAALRDLADAAPRSR